MLPRACQGLFECGPATAQKQPRSASDAPQFESNAAAARLVRLSVFFGLGIGLLIHTGPRGRRSRTPPGLPPVGLVYGRSTMVVLRRGCIPLHKLTLEIRSKLHVRHKVQVLEVQVENGFGCIMIGKACGSGIAVSCAGRGSHHVGDHAVQGSHHVGKHEPKYRVEKSRVTFRALQFVQLKIWIVCFIKAVDTILACIPLPLEMP